MDTILVNFCELVNYYDASNCQAFVIISAIIIAQIIIILSNTIVRKIQYQ